MYPKKITLKNDKLKKLIQEKGGLIGTGRTLSEDIEKLEADMVLVDQEIMVAEKAVDLSEFQEKQLEITNAVEGYIEQMKTVQKEMFSKLKDSVDSGLYKKYDILKEQKEKLEESRNKVALKAQKYNDKIIPLGRKLMEEYLENEYDDYDSIKIEDGEIVCTIFNHLDDFKKKFKK